MYVSDLTRLAIINTIAHAARLYRVHVIGSQLDGCAPNVECIEWRHAAMLACRTFHYAHADALSLRHNLSVMQPMR